MLIDWTLAFLPILVVLVLMVLFRWGAAKAGPAGWLAAMVIAALRFGAGLQLLALAHVRALVLTVDVLLIVWAAFLLYRVSDEAKTIEVLSEALPQLTVDRGMQALLIGWAFTSFLQGVGGFGVPMAVTAPVLVGLGFSPLASTVIPSLGHAWSITFGSLASSFVALMGATGLPAERLAPASAALLGLVGFGCGFTVAHAADGWSAVRRLTLPVLTLGAVMGATQYLLATHSLWNLGGFGGGLAGLAAGFLVARWQGRRRATLGDGKLDATKVLLALSGYLALIVITLLVQFVGPIHAALSRIVAQVAFPEVKTALGYTTAAGVGRKIVLLRHGGSILLYSSSVAYLIYRWAGLYAPGAAARILSGTLRRVMSASVGIAVMIAMATVMANAGMTDTLARGLAQGVGRLFPLISPWIGVLGAFTTGSNTNSNVVFAALQLRTAELLDYSVPWILAAQTTGGAIGSILAPTKVVVGAGAVGMGGDEGTILRALLGYTTLLVVGVSLALVLILGLWPR